MRIKTITLLTFFVACTSWCFSQVTIEDCYKRAQANYPLIEQYNLIEKTMGYNLSNANKGYLPQVSFSAKATYQSDVTKLPIDLSSLGFANVNIPTLSKDQYGATLDVNQIIWDGGTIKSQKETIRTSTEVDKQNIEVSIYAINERVNQLYFGILLTDAQIAQNEILQSDLLRNYNQIVSYIKNGVANQSDLDAVKIDQLKAKQTQIQYISTRKAYVEMLSILIGDELSVNDMFVKPTAIKPLINEIKRPELSLYDAQIKNLEAQNNQITSSLLPKLGLFVTGGYGRPGLNMLDSDFSAYYIGGVSLSWNLGSFYTKKNDKRNIQNSINSINVQRETFLFNTNIDIAQKNNEIDKYIDQLKYDNQIIELRTDVKQASEIKMANGMLSGTDLMRDVNAEQMAKQDKILHETELLLAIYNLKFATNN